MLKEPQVPHVPSYLRKRTNPCPNPEPTGIPKLRAGLWLAGNEGMEKKMETTIEGLGFTAGIKEWKRTCKLL